MNNQRFKIYQENLPNKWDHIMSIIWLYIMVFPTSVLYYISIPILFVVIYNRQDNHNKIIRPLLFLIVPTTLFNLFQPYMDFKAYSRLVTFVVIFYTFASYKGYRILFAYILLAILYIFVSQISMVLNFPYLASFFDQTYNLTETAAENGFNLSDMDALSAGISARLGGIYFNGNNCGEYLSVIYAMGLCSEDQLDGKKRILLYPFICLVAISMLLTGSRTAFVVFGAISLYYLYAKGYDVRIYLLIVTLLIIVILSVDIGDFRAFKVKEGMDSSIATKVGLFNGYISNITTPIWYLFGAGDIMVTTYLDGSFGGSDFDLGNIFINFGAFFYLAYVFFVFRLYYKLIKRYRVIMFVLLWTFSNSILINYRMCPVFFMSLGILYRQSLYLKYKSLLSVVR